MTEEEAATKMCCGPLGGVHFTQAKGIHHDLTCCIGSVCMAWRWATGPGEDPNDPTVVPTQGYCGLAGK